MANTDSIYWIDAYITPGHPGFLDRRGNSSCCTVVTIGLPERMDFKLWCIAWYQGWRHLLDFIDDIDGPKREIIEIDIAGPFNLKLGASCGRG